PPWYHTTDTGAPLRAIARALASAWPSGNSESDCPWTISAGTLIRSATDAGLDRRSVSTAFAVGRPFSATSSYMSQRDGRKRPHAVRPALPVKNIPAHSFLNTPREGPAPAASGNSASGRLCQVIRGAIASIRGSCAAVISAIAPP